MMKSEAVFGAEMYDFKESMSTNAHFQNTILPFARNVIGSMDYTPVTFTDARYPHPTTYAHELALSVMLDIPLYQHHNEVQLGHNIAFAVSLIRDFSF